MMMMSFGGLKRAFFVALLTVLPWVPPTSSVDSDTTDVARRVTIVGTGMTAA